MSSVPRGWARATLGELCLPVGKHDPRDRPETRIDYIDIGGIESQEIRETKSLLGADAPSRARQLVQAGDTILSTVRTYLMKTALVPKALDGATASTGFCVLRPGLAIDPRFLFHRVLESRFVASLSSLQTGSSYPAVRDKDVFAQPITVPPWAEQLRIVAAIEEQFSRLEAADRNLDRGLSQLASLRRTALRAVAEVAGEPRRVGEVAEVQGGIQKQPKRRPRVNRFPFLRVANVRRGELDLGEVHEVELFDGELERLALRAGDLLVVEGNGSADQIGRSALWRGEIENCVHQNHLIRVRPGPELDPRYLNLYWNAPPTAARLTAIASSTSGLYTLSTSKLRSLEMLVPPLDEQRHAVDDAEQRLSLIDAMRESIESTRRRGESLRMSILQRAFRGELVPQDPSDEPAATLLERIQAERANWPSRRRTRPRAGSAPSA